MAVDPVRGLLFIACYVNNSVAIVDINSGRFVRSIVGLNNPQGVAWVPLTARLYVSNAGDGTLNIYDGGSFAKAGSIALSGDADNLRYDAATKLLYVGFGSGGIAAVNTTSNAVVFTKALPAHPESFQVEATGRAIYVNVPPTNLLVAFEKTTGASLSNRTMAGSNFPMALDEANQRLLIATRNPPELRVLDISTPSLASVANLTIAADADDVFVDAAHRLVYVSCGQGTLEVIRQVDPNHYSVMQTIPTGQGARTSLFVPEIGELFVAVPSTGGNAAEVSAYGLGSPASTSFTSTTSGTKGGQAASGNIQIRLNITPQTLLVPLGGSMVFKLVMNDLLQSSENLSVSASSPRGLTVSITPTNVTTYLSWTYVALNVSSSATAAPGDYPVTIFVRSQSGVINETLDFSVVQYLVKFLGVSEYGKPNNANLTILVGSSVTWFNLDDGADEMNPMHKVVFQNIAASSGVLDTFDSWTYTFSQPGVYRYIDTFQSDITPGVINVVVPVPAAPVSLSVSPTKGPSGLAVTVTGSGYVPGTTYQICVGAQANKACGFEFTSASYPADIGPFAIIGGFVADQAGRIPAGTRVTIPDLFGGNYSLGVTSNGAYTHFVASAFTVETPTISVGVVTVPASSDVTVTGRGYAPSTTYTVCLVPLGTVDCGYSGDREETPPGWHLGTFTADANGNVPSGTKVTTPNLPTGQYVVGAFDPRGGYILISQVQLTLTAST